MMSHMPFLIRARVFCLWSSAQFLRASMQKYVYENIDIGFNFGSWLPKLFYRCKGESEEQLTSNGFRPTVFFHSVSHLSADKNCLSS